MFPSDQRVERHQGRQVKVSLISRCLLCAAWLAAGTACAQTVPLRAPAAKMHYTAPAASSERSTDTGGWRAELQRAGILSEPGPYRMAVPLTSLGDDGARLLLAYVPRLKDGVGSKVVMFVIRAPLD